MKPLNGKLTNKKTLGWGWINDAVNSVSDGLASIDPTADNAVGNLFASLDPSQQLEELKKFLNTEAGQNLLKIADITLTLATSSNPAGAIFLLANELALKPAFERFKQQQIEQLTNNQFIRLYDIRKTQWQSLQEYRNKKQRLDALNAEIIKQQEQSNAQIAEIQSQIQQNQPQAPTANPEPTPKPETKKEEKKEMNYLAFFGLLGGSVASGGSAYYFRKNKNVFFLSLFFVIVFVVLAFVFRTKKTKTTPTQELKGGPNGEWGSCTAEEGLRIRNNEGIIGLVQKCNLPPITGNFLSSYMPEGNFTLPVGDLGMNFDYENLNQLDPNFSPEAYLCENYNINPKDEELWALIGIPLNEDYLAKMVTYNCTPNEQIRRLQLSADFSLQDYQNFLQTGNVIIT